VSRKRRSLIALATLAVVAIVVVGLLESGGGPNDSLKPLSAAEVKQQVAGAPAALAAIHAQGNQILGGGKQALRARIAALRGHPVVVNVWGSWCAPCRAEAPILQRVAVEHSKAVAFLGVDTQDPEGAAKRFLAEVPMPYPSYQDLRQGIAHSYGLLGTPSTIFYDSRGRQFVHQSQYHTKAELEADLRKYALGD
jgi:cytochrome c biogenesis protein CcmG, thiol:disulfide interchange protein DsbE